VAESVMQNAAFACLAGAVVWLLTEGLADSSGKGCAMTPSFDGLGFEQSREQPSRQALHH